MLISDWSSDVCSSDLTIGSVKDKAGFDLVRLRQRLVGRHGRGEELPTHAEHIVGLMLRIAADRIEHDVGVGDALREIGRPIVDHLVRPELPRNGDSIAGSGRSEEHTSELQSLMRISYAVF